MKVMINRLKESLEKEKKEGKDPNVLKSLDAVFQGISNFYLNRNTKLAKQRAERYCNGCEFNISEPIESLRVKDKRVPALSGRTCKECGCVLSYKLRQNIQQKKQKDKKR